MVVESNQDPELSDLGAPPDDLRTILTRNLGDRPVTLSYADELLEALTRGVDALDSESAGAPPGPVSGAFDARKPPVPLQAPAQKEPQQASALPPPPVFVAASPPPAPVPPLFNARPLPSSVPPPLFDARAVSVEPPNVFDAREPDPEATAQAIQAAFEDPESEPPPVQTTTPHDMLLAAPVAAPLMSPAPSLELASARPRRGSSGARRPDLDQLLEQPLDALEFERSEPLTRPTPNGYVRSEPSPSEPPPPAAAAADDFEILVDDEILEIAEDDVELVDDEGSS